MKNKRQQELENELLSALIEMERAMSKLLPPGKSPPFYKRCLFNFRASFGEKYVPFAHAGNLIMAGTVTALVFSIPHASIMWYVLLANYALGVIDTSPSRWYLSHRGQI